MKPEKFHAADYTPSEVEAAKRVMIEVAQNLGEYADACVVVGGWVPELLLPEAEPKHTGSIDVDLALNPKRLSGERYASLLDALKRKGYQPGEKPFQLFKEVKIGREKIRVDVEFLAPKGAKMKKNQPKRVPGFRVLETEGCALAFDDPAIVTIEGKMPDERTNRVSIRVASVADFLVMKGYALAGRDKPKDAYDIYFCLKNYRGGPIALARELRPKLRLKEVRKGLEHIAGKFRSAEDFGPSTVVRFLASGDADEQRFQAQDAFGQVERLLRDLGISETET
jgi:hypothetical protein